MSAVPPPLPVTEQGKTDRFSWTDIPILFFAMVATWYLLEYQHYDVVPAICTSAGGLGTFVLVVLMPKGLRQLTNSVAMLNGNVAMAVNLAQQLSTQAAPPAAPQPMVITAVDAQAPAADGGHTGQQ